ncbi:MAG: MFS transporter [Actinobacteria bacterium]|nr:MFS transporter [Actinomycetota bacterium]
MPTLAGAHSEGSLALGTLLAGIGVGAIIGNVALRGRLRSPRQNTTTMLAGLFAASVSAVLLGVSKILVTDFAILMLLGAGWEWGTVARGNSLQLHVPEAIAGRMVGFYYLVTLGVNALGALLLGVLFTHLGVDPSTMLVGVVVLVLMLGLALTRRAGLD